MAIRQHRYPLTAQQQAATVMLGGELPVEDRLTSGQFDHLNSLYGQGEAALDRMAGNPAIPGIAPWARAMGDKKNPSLYDRQVVREALAAPRSERVMGSFDPRQLHGSQSGITREGLDYYMSDQYANTGQTYADQGNAGNAQPVVYRKSDGRDVLLSGHHRAGAALAKGEPLNALRIEGP